MLILPSCPEQVPGVAQVLTCAAAEGGTSAFGKGFGIFSGLEHLENVGWSLFPSVTELFHLGIPQPSQTAQLPLNFKAKK